MPSAQYQELQREMAGKQRALAAIFDEYDGDVAKIPTEKASDIRKLDSELKELGERFRPLAELEGLRERTENEVKRLGEPVTSHHHGGVGDAKDTRFPWAGKRGRDLLTEATGWDVYRGSGYKTGGIALTIPGIRDMRELKTLFSDNRAAQFKALFQLSNAVQPAQYSEPVLMALEERTVADLIPERGTSATQIKYLEETTNTNNAAEVAEGGTKPESALAFTERTDDVKKIADTLPVTKEALDDIDFLEGYISDRLTFHVRRREETQLLLGNGVGVNILGIANRAGVQTLARNAGASEPNVEAIYRMIAAIRNTGFAEPTGIALNPTNWTTIRLMKTADGVYIFGPPSMDEEPRLWGLMVRPTTAMTLNTALVGAFRPHAQIWRREGIDVVMSTEHATNFVENKVTVLAEERLALAVYRPSAFGTVTALN